MMPLPPPPAPPPPPRPPFSPGTLQSRSTRPDARRGDVGSTAGVCAQLRDREEGLWLLADLVVSRRRGRHAPVRPCAAKRAARHCWQWCVQPSAVTVAVAKCPPLSGGMSDIIHILITNACLILMADPARLHQVEPELQVGPTCGLVALRMAASTLLERTGPAAAARVCSVHELLAKAIARGFSLQGTRSEN